MPSNIQATRAKKGSIMKLFSFREISILIASFIALIGLKFGCQNYPSKALNNQRGAIVENQTSPETEDNESGNPASDKTDKETGNGSSAGNGSKSESDNNDIDEDLDKEIEKIGVISPKQLTGIWLTNVDSKVLYSKETIERAVARSKEFGVNAVYPVIWNKEEIFLKSKVVEKEFGSEFIASPDDMDVLKQVTLAAARQGLATAAWYENGLKVPIKFENGEYFKLGKLFEEKNWLMKDKNGRNHTDCEFSVCKGFLSPFHPEVQKFFIDFFTEVASYPGLYGVMIDDHFSINPDFGYDKETQDRYKAYRTQKNLSDTTSNFNRFRTEAVVDLIAKLKAAVNAKGKKFILSPGGTPSWSRVRWLLDWRAVIDQNAADEIIMQSYRYNLPAFKNLLAESQVRNAALKIKFSVAVLMGLLNNRQSSGKLIHDQTSHALSLGYGVSYFYYDTIDIHAKDVESPEARKTWHEKTTKLLKGI